MNWEQFTNIRNGTRVINHRFDQCVALANLYHESVIGGSFVPVASAYQWWTNFRSYRTLTDNYTQSRTPVAGAIVVSRYGLYNAPHGHIGVVTSVNKNGTFNTMEQNAEGHRYVFRYIRSMVNILGFLVPKNNPAVSRPSRGAKVRYYQRQDRDARSKGRTLSPGRHVYLNTKSGGPSNAANIVGGVGPYSITLHLYAKGEPGDVLGLMLIWQDRNGRRSHHYNHHVSFDKDGLIRENVTFKRAVASGYSVFARVQSSSKNKKSATINLFDSDAYLFN